MATIWDDDGSVKYEPLHKEDFSLRPKGDWKTGVKAALAGKGKRFVIEDLSEVTVWGSRRE